MKGKNTRERLLQVGLDQMSVHGVSGVTLGQLAGASGVSKSGLFAHFHSKEQLQVDLLDQMVEVADRTVVEPVMQEAKGLPRLSALVETWFGWTERAGLQGGCPIAAALFELDDLESEVRTHARVLEQRWRAFLCQLVRDAVEEGHLSTAVDVDQFVWELCGIYLSHHVSSRFLRDGEGGRRARRAFDDLVDRAWSQARPFHAGEMT